MNKNIDISVVIPMYNSEKTIERALNSVINQIYKGNIEIIVVNDGSKDNSLKIVEKYREKLKKENISLIIIDKANGGVSTARNIGLKKSRGNYIALLDSDDEWLEKKLEIQMEILKNNRDIDFLGCERNNEVTKRLFKKSDKDKLFKVDLKDLLLKMFPQTSTAILKKEILKDIGYYDEKQKYAEDGNYWLRICAKKNFYMLRESLVITGGGKPNFGFSGLSANLIEMHKGNIKNLKDLKNLKYITFLEFNFFKLFYILKHFRRKIIVKKRKI